MEPVLPTLELDPERIGKVRVRDLIDRQPPARMALQHIDRRLRATAQFLVSITVVLVIGQLAHRCVQHVAVLLNGHLFDRMPPGKLLGLTSVLFVVGLFVVGLVNRRKVEAWMLRRFDEATEVNLGWARTLGGRVLSSLFSQHYVSRNEIRVRWGLAIFSSVIALWIFWYAPPWEWWSLYSSRGFIYPGFMHQTLRSVTIAPIHACALFFVTRAGSQILEIRRLASFRAPAATRLEPLSVPDGIETTDPRTLRIAHWSDLHLAGKDDGVSVEGGATGDRPFRHLIEHHAQGIREADLVLLTGDVTDAGRPEEWDALLKALPDGCIDKLVLVPGNHDINIADAHDHYVIEKADHRARCLRLVRALSVLDRIQGTRAKVFWHDDRFITLRDYLSHYGEPLRAYYADPAAADVSQIEEIWNGAFPMIIEVPDEKIAVVVLDSSDRASSILTNAYGNLDQPSLRRLSALLARYPDYAFIFALHHHVALPPEVFLVAVYRRLRDALFIPAMVLQNGRALLSAIGDARHAVFFHGHRHVRYEASLGPHIDIVSAPSTTLGDQAVGSKDPAFGTFLVKATERGTRLAGMRWHRCTRDCQR